MKPNAEWGFTAHPDFPRICRELAETGCAVGLVTMKGESPVTLIDMQAKGTQVPAGVASAAVAGTGGRWRVVSGDKVKPATGVRPVRVEGYKASTLAAPAPEPCPWEKANAEDRARLASLRMFVARHADSTWTTADGSKVRVQAMSDSHLHYALAKAYRGEYPDSASRLAGIDALKAEAARRLLRTWGLSVEPSKPAGYTPPSAPAQPQPIGRVISYDQGSAKIQLFVPPYMRSPFDR
jgi:hypothetical protein